jgi:hypothetical protein
MYFYNTKFKNSQFGIQGDVNIEIGILLVI